MSAAPESSHTLRPYLSRRQVWAVSLGTSVGWGSLVVTCNTYLAQAGPMGTVLGLLAGLAIMLLVARNYHYLMNLYPSAGGAYTYVRDAFGHDRAFLVSWMLAMTYLAVLWANLTSLPLFARIFLGEVFQFGRLYELFGYEVYLGEVLLTVAALLLAAVLCIRWSRAMMHAMVVMVAVFFLAIVGVCVAALCLRDRALAPAFVPDAKAISQVVGIAVITPWAFIGFENVSHAVEEFAFPVDKSFRILTVSVFATTALYIAVALLSVTAFPPQYATWLDYIRDLGNLQGIEALPPFYAAQHYLGGTGVIILMAALLCLVITSFIGNIMALSRLFYAMAQDEILPAPVARLNGQGTPVNAILLIAAISCFIPLVGRTAIGWIVDVTTLGATIVYGFVSAAAGKMAAFHKDKVEKVTGRLGLWLMVAFGAYLLIPNFFQESSMATETYFLFVIWSVLGLLFFHFVLREDRQNRFGNAMAVWIVFLSLILFVSLVWMSQYTMRATREGMYELHSHFATLGASDESQVVVQQVLEEIQRSGGRGIMVVVIMFAISLAILFSNYTTMTHRAIRSEAELGAMRTIANTDPLTGVKNKLAYTTAEARLDNQIAAGTVGEFAVLVCDVNGLKHINDTQGHKAGDAYLCLASNMVCEFFKHSPVFRVGGDEFVVLMEGQDFLYHQEILEKFNHQVEENIHTGGAVISLGAAVYAPGRDSTVHAVFERADSHMYERKRQLKAMGAHVRG